MKLELLSVSKQASGQPEIFHSIQGEGITAGTPAVFLRLAFCNLKCIWCDTKYTWDWRSYSKQEEVVEMSLQEIEQRILTHDCRHIIVTGGEPLIQQNKLVSLLTALKKKRLYIEIETNGTIIPDSRLTRMVDQWNVSPKLENSGNPLSLREISGAYRFYVNLPSTFFKYVIQAQDDLNEVKELTCRYGIANNRVILMPEATSKEALIDRSKWLVEACKKHGYKFSTRLHILLWGNNRSV